jgi:hypothetical protein
MFKGVAMYVRGQRFLVPALVASLFLAAGITLILVWFRVAE